VDCSAILVDVSMRVGSSQLVLVCAGLLVGCLPPEDERCSPHQVLVDGFCMCSQNTIPPPNAVGDCVPCEKHQHATGGICVCDDGFASDGMGGCIGTPPGLGVSCSATMACPVAEFPTCHDTGNAGSYCTSTGCAGNDQCDGGFSCDRTVTPAFCKRPPTGLGMTCAAPADCAAFDASYCEMIQSHTCQVQNCSQSPDNCQVGSACCDLTMFSLPKLCVPIGMCPT
jgi:hypothetical protein